MPSTASKALPFLLVAGLENYGAWRLWPEGSSGSLAMVALASSLAWAGLATSWVAIAYALERPTLFFKATPFRALLLPFTAASATVARIARTLGVTERSEVAPGLWVGGWPSASSETWAQVDCTAELPRRGRASEYRCCPMLDGVAPSPNALIPAVQQVLDWRSAGRTVLVHCAYGHGRSAIVASAAMVIAGDAPNVDDAIRRIKSLRPGARFSPSQRMAVARAVEMLGVSPICGYSGSTQVKP
jgi:hypothetical protein